MKKMNKFGLLSITILLILVIMGVAVWNYFLGEGSLPSMNFMFFSLILFGIILLLIILNPDQVVKLSNFLSKEENTPGTEEFKTVKEIVPTPAAENEMEKEISLNHVEENEVKEEVVPIKPDENKEKKIVPTPKAEEKPKVEVKNTPIEKPAPIGNLKPFGSHSGNKRSGVWINEK